MEEQEKELFGNLFGTINVSKTGTNISGLVKMAGLITFCWIPLMTN
jgi:hypothetical protein